MVSINCSKTVQVADNSLIYHIEAACLSTDTKPSQDIAVGSICVEVDTGNVFFYDGSAWVKQFSFQE